MKNQMAPNIPLTIVLFAGVVAIALRAVARRPRPRRVLGTEPTQVTVTADENQPRRAVTTWTRYGTGHEMVRPPGPPGRSASVVGQMQHTFHELHADGRNALCAVCDGQYESA